jgi:hypothetical protein
LLFQLADEFLVGCDLLAQPGGSALHDGHFLPQVQYRNRVINFACRAKQSILDESL